LMMAPLMRTPTQVIHGSCKGTKYTLGSDDGGRMYDTLNRTSTQTYLWYLQKIRDTNGNYIKYTYLRDSTQIYPYQIIYAGNGSTDGPAEITFATSTRPHTRASYASDFKVTTNYRISEIDALFNGTNMRKYTLGYTQRPQLCRDVSTAAITSAWPVEPGLHRRFSRAAMARRAHYG
jgi:hypothetical protein